MDQLQLALRHRMRRIRVALDHLPRLVAPLPARSLAARQRRYLWSRLRELGRRPDAYRLLRIRRLDSPTEPSDAVWELRLAGPRRRRHRVGDTLLLRWENDPERVTDVLDALGADGDRRHTIVGYSSVFQPGRVRRAALSRLLREEYDLHVAGPRLLERAGFRASSPGAPGPGGAAGGGLDLLSPAHAGGGRGLDLLDVLRSATPPIDVQEFLTLQPRTTARAYSLSRIDRAGARDTVEIIVSAVRLPVKVPAGPIRTTDGRATGFVRRLATGRASGLHAAGVRADGVVRAWSLRHPWRLDVVGDVPVVIVVAGTGIAGAMAWLRERAERVRRGGTGLLPVWLLYGVRDWATRGLYRDELIGMVRDGVIARLDVAQSRSDRDDGEAEPAGTADTGPFGLHHRRRVTHVLDDAASDLGDWLRRGAVVYASGPKQLGPAVRKRLAAGVEAGGVATATTAGELLTAWEQNGRLQISVS